MEFSVLMSVYERERSEYLRQALESIRVQTLMPSEIVIVADGSLTGSLYDVIDDFKKSLPIVLIQLSKNQGLGRALRIGLESCKHEIVARFDSDDICVKNRFQIQLAEFKKDESLSVLGSYLEEFEHFPGDLKIVKRAPLEPKEIIVYSKKRNPMNHPSVMFRKSEVLQSGSYQYAPFFEDYYLWLRMLHRKYKFRNLPQSLVFFRRSDEMITRRIGIKYLKWEVAFFQMLLSEGLITYFNFLFLILVRLPVRLVPVSLAKKIYVRFLRS